MKPTYYQKGGMECMDAIRAATEGLNGFEGFLIGNVLKYAWRWDDKGGVNDLEKIAEYVRIMIEYRKGREGADNTETITTIVHGLDEERI